MVESEYETSLDSLMGHQQQIPQQQIPQQQMSQEQLEYQQQMIQPQYQQQMMPPVPQPFSPTCSPSGGLKLMEKLANVNYTDSIQTIIIIAVLFLLFGNCYFKNFCKTLPFMCVVDGEFNIQSLIILGVVVGICYVFIKVYLI